MRRNRLHVAIPIELRCTTHLGRWWYLAGHTAMLEDAVCCDAGIIQGGFGGYPTGTQGVLHITTREPTPDDLRRCARGNPNRPMGVPAEPVKGVWRDGVGIGDVLDNVLATMRSPNGGAPGYDDPAWWWFELTRAERLFGVGSRRAA